MRRLLAFVALLLLALGLELFTQTLSLTISRLGAGITAIRSGMAFCAPARRFVVGAAFGPDQRLSRGACETCGWIGLALQG